MTKRLEQQMESNLVNDLTARGVKTWWIDDLDNRRCALTHDPEIGLNKIPWPDIDHVHIAVDIKEHQRLLNELNQIKQDMDALRIIKHEEFKSSGLNYTLEEIEMNGNQMQLGKLHDEICVYMETQWRVGEAGILDVSTALWKAFEVINKTMQLKGDKDV